MIGDWVTFKNAPKIPAKIWDIAGDNTAFAFIFTDIENSLDAISLDKIIGIPLTPEILEKNGFKIKDGITSWTYRTEKDDLIDIFGVRDYHLSINIEDTHGPGKGYRWLLRDLTIHFVHELQHALKLCGIEKAIEL